MEPYHIAISGCLHSRLADIWPCRSNILSHRCDGANGNNKIWVNQKQRRIMEKITHLKELKKLMMSSESMDYNEEGKARFRRVGKAAMRELAEILELKTPDINFNPGGVAVSGDLRLMGMCNEEKGIYISINKSMPNLEVMYRSIKDMKDYTGGGNNWMRYEDLDNLEKLKSMRRVCEHRY